MVSQQLEQGPRAAGIAFLLGLRSRRVPQFPLLRPGEWRIWEHLQRAPGCSPLHPSCAACPPHSARVCLSVCALVALLLYAPAPWMQLKIPGGGRGQGELFSAGKGCGGKGPTPAWTHVLSHQPQGVPGPGELPPRSVHRSRAVRAGKVSRSDIVLIPGLPIAPLMLLNCPHVPSPA